MKILTIQVPDDSVDFVEEFVERIGGNVAEKKGVRKTKQKSNKKEASPTFLFGKWKDYDIDADKLRDDVWRREF